MEDETELAEFFNGIKEQVKKVKQQALTLVEKEPWSRKMDKNSIEKKMQRLWNEFAVMSPPSGDKYAKTCSRMV